MKKKLLNHFSLAFFALNFSMNAQVTVTGGSSATYSTVNDAFNAINTGIHTGAITIDITGNTTEPSTPIPLLASGQGTANYTSIIIRPTITATISGSMVTGRGILELDGADNVTIDGDIAGGAVGRDLSIVHTGATTLANTACVRLIGRSAQGLGINTFSLINCKLWGNSDGANTAAPLTSAFCFYAGTNAANITTTGAGDNYDNLFISNNEFRRAYQAIYAANTATSLGDNTLITNNVIGSPTPAEYVHFRGVNLNGVNNATVSLNDISNLRISSSASNAGIEINGTTSNNVLVERNKVYSIYSTSTGGWGAWGINCTGGTNHTIVNNVIYDIIASNYVFSTTFNAFGIRLTSGTGYKVYYNSVNLFGDMPTVTANTNAISACFVVTSTGVTGDVRNNIFNNQMTSSANNVTTKRFMAVWMAAGYSFLNMNFNNNAYMVSPANTTDYFVGKLGTTAGTFEYQNLAAWQVASQVNNATNDINSIPTINALAPFISNTNLNIAANAVTPIESGAVTLTVLGTPNKDHNNVNRPGTGVNPNTNPDMGAYEFDGLAGITNDVGVLAITAPAALQCLGSAVPVVVTIRNFGINTLASGVNIPVTVVLSGAANQTITSSYVVPLAGFPPASNVQYTLASTLNMATAGVYSLTATATMTTPLDINVVNNSSSITRTNVAATALPIQHNFTGFTGANLNLITPNGWYEAQGATFPGGTTSNWISQTNLNLPGNITSRVNLFGTTRREWIVGPKFNATPNTQLTFDAAITGVGALTAGTNMGSDDQLLVMVSTDCGATYAPIFTVSATNSLTTNFNNYVVPLSAYANQEVIIGFLATDGLVDDIESYDLHLDNINLYNVSPNDVGVNAFISPASNGCYSANNPVSVVLYNYGSASQSSINVSVVLAGPVTTTINTLVAGPIAPSSSLAVSVGTVNLTTGGTYTLKGYSSLGGDGNLLNDTTTITRVINPLINLPISNSFTGFTGGNLPTSWPNWLESVGAVNPSGTTSSWISQTGLNGAGNITARVNLIGNTKNEWIIGPRTLATASTQISFDYALTSAGSIINPAAMGSDDNVRVMVSTNCGLSYSPIFTLNVSNTNTTSVNFTNTLVNLSAYAGQEIIVAFLASEGTVDDIENYDFHLDNINLFNASATDAGVSVINSPSVQSTCYTAAEPVVVTIKNYGIATISNIPVNVLVSGAITQTLSNVFTPTLAAGATAVFTVGTLNMTYSGVYTFSATTNLGGDVNLFNNSTLINTTTNPQFNILGNLSICLGGSSTLTAVGSSLTYSWSNGILSSIAIITPSATTVFTVTANNGTCSAIKEVTLAVTNPTIVGNGVAVCSPTTIATLSATAFASPINWYASPTSTTSLAQGNTFTASAASTTTYYAEAQSTATANLFTTLAAGNGAAGNMFDIQAQTNIVVSGFDVHISSVAVTTVEVWFRSGSFVGFESSNVGWTQVLTTTVNALGTGSLTLVPANFSVSVPAGQTYAFYVTANGGGSFAYTNGVNLGNVYTGNSDIILYEGKGGGYFSVINSPRVFNGQMRYTKVGCTTPRIPVTLTVSATPSITINSSTTTICSGATTTLTASGATTYSWSTGSNSTSIALTPTVTTLYTLTGTNTAGCIGSNTTNIVVNPLPTVSVVSTTSLLCVGLSASLTASGANTYSWNTNATTSVIAISPTITTTYTVNGTSVSGCKKSATITQSVNPCLGFNNLGAGLESYFSVYPNPNNGIFSLETSATINITITDVLGKIVYTNKLEEGKHTLNLSNLNNGLYILKAEDRGNYKSIKVVKE